jgi:ribosomal protein S18 acetylase RimI-like enzyme
MQVSLKAMNEKSFSDYRKQAIPAYAKDNVESGRWQEADALERSKQDFQRLLPEGLASKNNYLFNVIDNKSDKYVGHVWVKVEDNIGTKSAFIYDIEIYELYRRKGYAKSALSNIENVVEALGATSLGLHVFHYNEAAMALYDSVGYQVVSHNMKKQLSAN